VLSTLSLCILYYTIHIQGVVYSFSLYTILYYTYTRCCLLSLSVLKECAAYLPDGTVERLVENCVFDFCSTKDQEMICTAFEAFALMCLEKKIDIEFRSQANCGKILA